MWEKKLHWYEAKSDSKVNKMTGNLIFKWMIDKAYSNTVNSIPRSAFTEWKTMKQMFFVTL
jgi:hypothetical protein